MAWPWKYYSYQHGISAGFCYCVLPKDPLLFLISCVIPILLVGGKRSYFLLSFAYLLYVFVETEFYLYGFRFLL